jgi:hypothetical protein
MMEATPTRMWKWLMTNLLRGRERAGPTIRAVYIRRNVLMTSNPAGPLFSGWNWVP